MMFKPFRRSCPVYQLILPRINTIGRRCPVIQLILPHINTIGRCCPVYSYFFHTPKLVESTTDLKRNGQILSVSGKFVKLTRSPEK
jgi:hypothetical protein